MQTWNVENGQIVGPEKLDLEIAAAWAADLADAVSERVHKDDGCNIASYTVLKACRMVSPSAVRPDRRLSGIPPPACAAAAWLVWAPPLPTQPARSLPSATCASPAAG